jgi:hypothetical protein
MLVVCEAGPQCGGARAPCRSTHLKYFTGWLHRLVLFGRASELTAVPGRLGHSLLVVPRVVQTLVFLLVLTKIHMLDK